MRCLLRASMRSFLLVLLLAALAVPFVRAAAGEPPTSSPASLPASWVDPDTGHRIVRLTSEPESASFYFNVNSYTPDGREMVYTTPEGISVLDLRTRRTRSVVQGEVHTIAAGHKTPSIFYIRPKERALYVTNVDTLETRRLGALPARGSLASINADETLAAGTYIEGSAGEDYNAGSHGPQAQSLL
ncbi:MAG TPA: hypothetical protein VGR96_08270, partial [Acidobacteriaceae bacterium]|nr:hypothetical protein [Acidobacteriaceae bacterium]